MSAKNPDRVIYAVVFGPKRHATFVVSADGLEFVDATEAGLGGTFADPPAMRGRVVPVDGMRRYSLAAVGREVDYADDKVHIGLERALRPPAPWDANYGLPFPALRRFIVKAPEMARALPACFRARLGTRYLEGEVDALHRSRMPVPVALDPGGDLAGWPNLEWVAKATGALLIVTTDPMTASIVSGDPGAVLLATLDDKAVAFGAPPRSVPVEAIVVDPARIGRVGRVSGVLDAYDEGMPGDLRQYRPAYRVCACGCDQRVERGRGARYVDDDHRRAARNGRRRQTIAPGLCECGCGSELEGGRRDRRFVNDTHRKAAARRIHRTP